MKFNYITIKNVRSYKGETTFYLSPEEKERPILIYGGNNGAGKTSLLNAFSICLYGKLALGDRVSKREYQEFLSDYVYRFGSTFEKEGAEITLSFDFARNGKIQSYNVTREWKKKQKNIVENFTVQKNDQLLMNIDPDDWDDFIRDILPPRLIDLMFFDGEEIKSIAEQDNPGKGLKPIFEKMLGLTLVDRLKKDLGIYLRKHSDADEGVESDIAEVEQKIEKIESKIKGYKGKKSASENKLQDLQQQIKEKEQTLLEEGYNFAEKRGELKERKKDLEAEIEEKKKELQNQGEGAIPFSLAPNLLRRVLTELDEDEEVEMQQSLEHYADDLSQEEFDELQDKGEIEGLEDHISFDDLQEILKALSSQNGTAESVTHPISRNKRETLRDWITDEVPAATDDFVAVSAEISEMRDEREEIRHKLSKVPDDKVIGPHIEELQELEEHAKSKKEEIKELEEKLEEHQRELEELQLEAEKLYEELSEQEQAERKKNLCGKVQLILKDYRQKLRSKKLEKVRKVATEKMNLLSHKDELFESIKLDPETFEIVVSVQDSGTFPLRNLSAGEKQVAVTALFWAVRVVSGRPLPIVVDTPMGRLDPKHKKNMVKRFFPDVSHQTILLPTYSEIGEEELDILRPYLSTAKTLRYQGEEKCTKVQEGYEPVEESVLQ